MVGLSPPEVIAALRSLRDSYMRKRQMSAGPHGALDKLIAAVDGAINTGEAPIANMIGALRPSPKLFSQPIARLSRGERVRLLGVGGGTPGGSNRGWWQVQSRAGVTGWVERKDLFPDAPVMLSSQPGAAGHGRQPDEIELGVRDTIPLR